ncbi:MAG: 4Fe-4S binding protein [Clostridium sp.]|uniref:4Fe-4S binding protein n=1 Tax=Clostridium sp. TaxID=1506 RepID=UPI003F2ABBF6
MFKVPFLKEAMKNLFRKPVTETSYEVKEGYRGKIVFDSDKCIGCGLCTRVCAPCAIEKEVLKIDSETQKITLTFDLTSCTFCGMCSDFCTKKAITLSRDYNMIVGDGEGFIVSGSFNKTLPKKKV